MLIKSLKETCRNKVLKLKKYEPILRVFYFTSVVNFWSLYYKIGQFLFSFKINVKITE